MEAVQFAGRDGFAATARAALGRTRGQTATVVPLGGVA